MKYLRDHVSEIENDPYTMALVTYAMHQEREMFVINGNVIQAPPKISQDAQKMLDKMELLGKGTKSEKRRCVYRKEDATSPYSIDYNQQTIL